MKRIRQTMVNNLRCAICGAPVYNLSEKERKWRSNGEEEAVVGICFMSDRGDPIEAYDLCDDCIGKLYSKMIY